MYTILIIIVISIISIIGFKDNQLLSKYAFSPYLCKHQQNYYRFFSHVFIHADWQHLLFNMISFYMFGQLIENSFLFTYGTSIGALHYFILFFAGGLFSTIWPYITNQNNSNYVSVGASGAVSAIIFAGVLWNPTMQMGLIFLPIPIPAYIFGPLYLAFEYWAFKKSASNIAHDAHIGGALFGIAYTLLINHQKGIDFIHLIFK